MDSLPTEPVPALLHFMLRLRDAGFMLGLEDYVALRRLVTWYLQRQEHGNGDRDSFFRLVCLICAKDKADEVALKREFDAFIKDYVRDPHAADPLQPGGPAAAPDIRPEPASQNTQIIVPSALPRAGSQVALPRVLPPPSSEVVRRDPLTQASLARTAKRPALQATLADSDLPARALRLRSDYFPITRRQMQQSWRHVRRSVRTGPRVELDIEATVEKAGREGIL